MTKEEYEHIRYAAGKAYSALKKGNKSHCFVYLWILNYRLGLLDREFYGDEDSGS